MNTTETRSGGEGESVAESVEVEVVPGMEIWAKFWRSRTGWRVAETVQTV